MFNLKTVSSLLAPLVLTTGITMGDAFLQSFVPTFQQSAIAAPELTVQEKIQTVTKNKGQIGGGDQLRRFFFGDLEPLGVQPGGAGMVVNLYNKANNVTFAYCTTYDVVVGVKSGKVAMFPANEVK
ncbi:MAG: hypothetical protein ACRC6M_06130 [Microcystaceae cyanobacterium]